MKHTHRLQLRQMEFIPSCKYEGDGDMTDGLEEIVVILLENEEAWNAVAEMARNILVEKEKEER